MQRLPIIGERVRQASWYRRLELTFYRLVPLLVFSLIDDPAMLALALC